MSAINRRNFIKMAAGTGIGTALWTPLLSKALAVQAHNQKRSIEDVKHIVILMQENRSFDHYFGTMKGVRGFGDRFPIPLESGRRVFQQSDGERLIPPYRANRNQSNAAFVQGTPHGFQDMQAAWNQGKYGFWPLYKTPYSMAYYTREEIPFQYAMAESFTICDAYFCSHAGPTDPNRIFFFSGAHFDPEKRAAGVNCTDSDSEPENLRCWIKGALPEPGYTYQGSAFKWPTIPDVLEENGISWRIYQDPNNNWTGAMHGCLAFESFRQSRPGSPIYENGMRHWSLEDLKNDVLHETLPQVSWVLPSKDDSEHPGAPSSPYRAADFTHQILEAITANPEVWSKTVFFITFDENDGLFDHVPAPAVPSYNRDGSLAGKSTLDLGGMYFDNGNSSKNRLDKRDNISGNLRPWGPGPRVPLYILSPWSKGGWVNSETADHTSVGQFIEKRFGIRLPAISPWHRAVFSDLTSAFDFVRPNDPQFPRMPDTSDYKKIEAASNKLPKAKPQEKAALYQEKGARFSRALPYRLHCHLAFLDREDQVKLIFENQGNAGAVYHVYDMNRLGDIPRRYTVEAGKSLDDLWTVSSEGAYHVEVYGPNGYFHEFQGNIRHQAPLTRIEDHKKGRLSVLLKNTGSGTLHLSVRSNAYGYDVGSPFVLKPDQEKRLSWDLSDSGNWYDFSLLTKEGYSHRFAGRLETGKDSISDPAMAYEL